MKVIIGSKNPAKVQAVKNAFSVPCNFVSIDVPSGVNAQPRTDDETIQGAINRATNALNSENGHIGIGLEGGVQETNQGLFLCNWGALVTKNSTPIIAGGARILLPEEVGKQLRLGRELGPVMDEYTSLESVGKKQGAVGIFTNGKLDRAEMFTHVTKLLVGQFEYINRKNNHDI